MSDSAAVRAGGFRAIAISTLVAGLLGYAITTVAARGLGPDEYADFSSFWGMQYLLVGTFGGLQQEFSRAVSPTASPTGAPRVTSRFAVAGAGVAALVSLAVVSVAGPIVFAEGVAGFGAPLLVGLALYAVVAVYSGVMYGISAWRVLAVVIVADPLLRLAGIAIVLLAGGGATSAVWASVVPYLVVLGILVGTMMRGTGSAFAVDVGPARLAANAARTVGAAVGVSVLVSGLPLLVGLARGEASASSVGVLVFVLILTRAPLVLAVLSLQSYLIVRLRDGGGRVGALLAVGVVAAGAALALAGYLVGSPVIEAIAGPRYAVDPVVVAVLVASSVATALLGVTGAVVLARSRHGVYVAGWTIAAAMSALLMFVLPGTLETRVAAALAVGPLLGLAVHALALLRPGPGQANVAA